ncbi:MAG: hypothetical protein HN413_03375 [Chloroflexi bacterium]|jgi:hypothetical protein|nr:hypothetical protein [Chloroflexota bacterium]
MTNNIRQQKIASYGQAYNTLKAVLARIPKEAWNYRPTPDRWTIREIIIHITDSEANSYVRCRRFIAEPGKDLMAYNENQWAKALKYGGQNIDTSLELFRWLRQASYELIRDLPDEVWAHENYHPENGMMTMDDWLDTYESHVNDHTAQMEEIFSQWEIQVTH